MKLITHLYLAQRSRALPPHPYMPPRHGDATSSSTVTLLTFPTSSFPNNSH